jgi:adenylyl cyclase-associated protein
VQAAPVTAAKPKVVATPKVKAVTKEFKNSTWYLENMKEGEELFEGSENVSKRIGFNLYANQNCSITVKGKCRSMVIEACKKMSIYVDSCVSEIYLMNCTNVKVFCIKDIKTVSLEASKEITVNLTKSTRNCMVTSTCCRGVFVRFPKTDAPDEPIEENDFTKMPVPETYESKVSGDELITKPMESLE